MDQDDYERRLDGLQRKLILLQRAYVRQERRGIVVLEGWDAAGKGGLIRRIAWCMDPRALRVWPVGPPDEHERRRHWLRRFWLRIPRSGEIAVFDRSWYGRVLVERIEGFADEAAWTRAYDEINDFEKALTEEGYRIVKLLLDITPETQLERFRARYAEPAKRWKITEDDLRNRAHWDDYKRCYDEMFGHCHSAHAPWHRVDFNSKKRGRLAAMELILEVLGKDVDIGEPEPTELVRAFFERD